MAGVDREGAQQQVEKLTEVLFAAGDDPRPTTHDKIRRVNAHPLSPDGLERTWPPDLAPAEALHATVDHLLRCDETPAGPSTTTTGTTSTSD